MSDASPYLENAALRHFLRGNVGGDAAVRPTQYQMSVHTADPGENGVNNEAAGGSYARQPIAFGETTGSSPTVIPTSVVVEFTDMPAGTWSHGFLWGDIDSTWEPLGRLNFVSAHTTASGNTITFLAGDITFDMD